MCRRIVFLLCDDGEEISNSRCPLEEHHIVVGILYEFARVVSGDVDGESDGFFAVLDRVVDWERGSERGDEVSVVGIEVSGPDALYAGDEVVSRFGASNLDHDITMSGVECVSGGDGSSVPSSCFYLANGADGSVGDDTLCA